ncbi:unnamed protein product [Cladocopium goreaui]|uniref:Integral membrane protein, Mpv17/PMP22 family n=1 Tax=Cladocopium goreaui TaxID=2562237 RepID=A0A9P1BLM9_9DINO|nr:unnamed protein product [Cladocopium goreaui]
MRSFRLARLAEGFQRAMARWPMGTTMANTTVLWVVSDSLSQSIAPEQMDLGHDWARTGRMVSYGVFFYAGLALKWYDLLERKFPMTSIRMVSCKVAADQLIFTPITASSLFFLTTLLEGKSVQTAREKVEERLLPTLKMNWCIWPFIQAVNLSVVPPPWRILVINAACIPWLAFVSWMANKRTEHGTAATGSITWPEPSWTKLSTGRIQEAVV